MLAISMIANAVLAIALLVVVQRAKTRIREEKLATFAGCLAAITTGLAREESGDRMDTIGSALAKLTGRPDLEVEATTFLLSRAALFRVFRNPCLADIGEHLRLLALQSATRSDDKGDEICDYIAEPGRDDGGTLVEPRSRFGDDYLAAAQFEAEGQLLDHYQTRIASMPVKLFG